jgi:hypothetical protein
VIQRSGHQGSGARPDSAPLLQLCDPAAPAGNVIPGRAIDLALYTKTGRFLETEPEVPSDVEREVV